ncbi:MULTISPECIES: 4-(cytidine 5'-diphospho)-2-C-methyl-D-erythritol kinase [unclassified Actinomyces]|uniref:GHMP family kinase ATP-binding protein n=1 Tax=unclassified Actinomyces TaxID=2609248 RepID=UPI0028935090|nr:MULTISPECIES: 4-(cytidine 5'-diphospho)-2-C-methyl-D-erythritol kinase [unclassified Actinomyces]MCL3776819.1 4-(cytidine 5'-diphospho)-2-C-methyl-D-erythritol kinase [Actinomyces sp. AC-20-1]MCL3789728.1 4-(cytidine 5'-diphospho)-2-C-methyl-D-erythritol kinase [Actinomyces sp. 187325]MCL3792085.1 4-(cytidine 5'-diphospho)-2-C-methyl-D-erythritol kinase [Actinomyces sp. 186855]MCL3794736.1 4-(cytidine 5'-diphospho)-2-C-methyl-D-erythritol kinase [Actinomyces sp. 217892]
MSHLRAVPSPDEQPRTRSGSATSVRVEAPGRLTLFHSRGAAGADGEAPATSVYQAVRLITTVTARRQSRDAHGTVTLTPEEPGAGPLDTQGPAARAARALAQAVGVTEGVDLLLRRRAPARCGLGVGAAEAAATLVACNHLWGTGLTQPELRAVAAGLGGDAAFPLTGACAVGRGRELSPVMTRGAYQWVLAVPEGGLDPAEVLARHDALGVAGHGGPRPHPGQEVPEALTAALRAGDTAALSTLLHNDLEEAVLSLRPVLADVITTAERAGALRALVAGTGPAVAALVADTVAAARVTRALSASGLVAHVLRADAPVAGARVVG